MLEFMSHSVSETQEFAAKLAKQIKSGAVIAFTGGMGMGKTAFTRGFASGLGNDSFVSSPTFAIVNDYGGSPRLYHFDMYRVETWDDLYSTGFFDYIGDDSVLLIEWSENIEKALPEETIFIDIKPGEEETDRLITVRFSKGYDEREINI